MTSFRSSRTIACEGTLKFALLFVCLCAPLFLAASAAHSQVLTEFPVASLGGDIGESITVGPDDNLWFGSSNLCRMTTTGQSTCFNLKQVSGGQVTYASYRTKAADGNLWFAAPPGRIGRITPQGFVTWFAAGSVIASMAAGPDGNVWFTEPDVNRVGRITPSGAVTEFSLPWSPGKLRSITAGQDGNMWFTRHFVYAPSAPEGDAVGRITMQGSVTEFTSGITPGAGLDSIVAGPGGLWFTEGAFRVGRITTQGAISEFSLVAPGRTFIVGNIVAGADGNLWVPLETRYIVAPETVSNWYIPTIGRITPQGAVTLFNPFGPPAASTVRTATRTSITGMAAGPDGNLWVNAWATAPSVQVSIGRIDLGVPPTARLDVQLAVLPEGDPGRFDLKLNGVSAASDLGGVSSTRPFVRAPGTLRISEAVVPTSTTSKYLTVFGGACDAAGQVTLVAGDRKLCTVTNRRDNPACRAACQSEFNQCKGQAHTGNEIKTCIGERTDCLAAC